jgi:hypothetical protein
VFIQPPDWRALLFPGYHAGALAHLSSVSTLSYVSTRALDRDDNLKGQLLRSRVLSKIAEESAIGSERRPRKVHAPRAEPF